MTPRKESYLLAEFYRNTFAMGAAGIIPGDDPAKRGGSAESHRDRDLIVSNFPGNDSRDQPAAGPVRGTAN